MAVPPSWHASSGGCGRCGGDVERTHASFFSGVGGLDMGLERVGWRTVSFSEIDPYASAVLTQRWPRVPNLGDITGLAGGNADANLRAQNAGSWAAHLWTGGFPCQDLSVAGKRRGLAGARSGLAFAFLALVERHRPPAVLLENVPGLLSSHAGRDLGTLLGTLGELGYGWAYRVLDAQHFGVPQRRRRVFILGIHARVDPSGQRAAEVLSVGSRCPRHPATGHETGEGAADGADGGADRPGWGRISHALSVPTSNARYDPNGESYVVSPSPDSDRVRAADGLAGRLDGGGGVEVWQGHGSNVGPFGTLRQGNGNAGGGVPFVAATLNSGGNNGGFRTEPGEHLVYRKATKAHSADDWERWERTDVTDTLDAQGMGAVAGTLRVGGRSDGAGSSYDNTPWGDYPATQGDDALLPLGLDSHRYRCCGNGVVSSVAEWIGVRLLEALA